MEQWRTFPGVAGRPKLPHERSDNSSSLHGRVPRRKPLLNKKNIKARLSFARKHLDDPQDFWEHTLWTDETKMELFGRSVSHYVWRKSNTAFQKKNITPTVKYGGGSVMVCGCSAASGPGRLAVINETMNSAVYQKILKENVRLSVCDLKLKRTWVLQQDNDPKHTSKSTSEWLKKNKMKTLEWPSQSPDLNPIEMLWHDLKKVVHARKPSNVAELQQFCKDEWAKIPPQRCNRLSASYGKRLIAVVAAKGKGRELADMMERRKVDILCVQETRWKSSKARSIGTGFKLFYYGVDSKRNGVGVVLKEEFVRNVLEVKRVSDSVMSLKLEIEGVMLNVVSGYAPQVGCELKEKERFWSELDEVMESIPTGERVVIGADFNGHVGEGNTGDEEVMGKFGVKERNLEGQMVVDFAKRMGMGVVNTYFQKREEHRVTYKSGGRRTQVDYILCRRGNLKEISDCKVVVGESVARQHRMVVCRMTLLV
ncbi:hypothetical protein QTP70_005167 [Hemibagrus guttatus]|uniref:Tc1-like transposase DDE domain-containing protein n=1 Tax=Hemibagrus guttatus TaxID=175788 RepID=A0AAE0R8V9_9TELE|nr:hypothetical protein QTP70_005167 [Hemibagrus guttatus]